MSESSRRQTDLRAVRHPDDPPRIDLAGGRLAEVESWLAAEARHDVPAAEAALSALFDDRRARRRSPLADRVMAAARVEGTLRRPWWGRYALAGATLGVWIVALAGLSLAAGLLIPGSSWLAPSWLGSSWLASSWLAGGLTQVAGALAEGVRVAHFGWDLVRGLQQALWTLLAAPQVTAWMAMTFAAVAFSWFWLGRLLAADASDATNGCLETA